MKHIHFNLKNTLTISIASLMSMSLLTSCGGNGGNSAPKALQNDAPVAIILSPELSVTGDTVEFDGAYSEDINQNRLTYEWTLIQKPTNSKTQLSYTNKSIAPLITDVPGQYTVSLTVNDGQGLTHTTTQSIEAFNNVAPVADAGGQRNAILNTNVFLSGALSRDGNYDPLVYQWRLISKPTNSEAVLINAKRVKPYFKADQEGLYTFGLTVLDNHGAMSSNESIATVNIITPPPIINNVFTVACAGIECGASNETTYKGTGIGVWQYNNTTEDYVNLTVDIGGVKANNQVTLAFSNATLTPETIIPSFGALPELFNVNHYNLNTPTAQLNNPSFNTETHNHYHNKPLSEQYSRLTLKDNRHSALRKQHEIVGERLNIIKKIHANAININAEKSPTLFKANTESPEILRQIAKLKQERININTNNNPSIKAELKPNIPKGEIYKQWFDTAEYVTHKTAYRFSCFLPTGRQVVFWQDVEDTKLTPALLKKFTDSSCGNYGSFAQLNALIGDVWGPIVYPKETKPEDFLLPETSNFKQDINVVFLNKSESVGWGGYFDGSNNFMSNKYGPTNRALAFFINTYDLSTEPEFLLSTLTHEATHMTHFYQNNILRKKSWANIWLDETTAMMAEDIIVPTVLNYNEIERLRIPQYLRSGGSVSLNEWSSRYDYGMGGTLGAFLNRQYGTSVFEQLVTGCNDPAVLNSEYFCLDSVIQAQGGQGIQETFSQLGASLYSLMPSNTAPLNYGFSGRTDGFYHLKAIDLSTMSLAPPEAIGDKIGAKFKSMSHTYSKYTVPMGPVRYTRKNIIVPPNSHLKVVVQ